MKMTKCSIGPCLLLLLLLQGCSFNPFSRNNHTTGSAAGTAIGAGIGGGAMALMSHNKPLIGASAIVGGAIGYYVTTQRFDAGGIKQAGGDVYSNGQYIGIDIPVNKLFEPNSAELLPQASTVLDSVVAVLQRNPNNNILISGNTGGFGREKRELALSTERARQVATYLWESGINNFQEPGITVRRIRYTGYGDLFPISSRLTNAGIQSNNRIQITSYPSTANLHIRCDYAALHNMGEFKD
ncbi:MAG: hypothetical protein A3F43_01330 [Gammaproteobacteria bacterium RIFCSPHIGHO2_12_FULL_42_10]|nr:MAG: hypothetical protein A3F43_01330 [Gammaproteobacteria bacterium RIFCSPHIGHO2_12_FULL_42_10]